MGEKRCLGCMERFPDKLNMCPYCGYVVNTPVENAVHMEPGTLLSDRYVVGKVLGYGGFGVTYIGWDGRLRQKVAIKEYFPTEFSTRMPGKTMLTLSNDQKKREQFESGLVKFVDEAKRLAKFQNTPGIVKIFDAFKENDTAYIIMEYLDGETLTELLERVGPLNEDRAVNMLMPVMKSLEIVHQTGIIHRDIAPDNIFITRNGEVKLIDFGASRYATTSHSKSITVLIKPGYSPEEQYRSRSDQGPHTDVYALAATLYKMITGTIPPDALERRASCETKRRDPIKLPHLLNNKISKNVENALLNALNVRIEDRTPDIKSFIEELQADPPVRRRYGNIKKIDLYQWPLWTKIAIPVLAVLIIAGGVFAIANMVHPAPPVEAVLPNSMVIVPEVEGEKMSEAAAIIQKGELNVTIAGNIESNYIEAEKIVLQDPLGGSYQDRYGNVNIWVSGGEPVPGVIPLLVGSTEEEAIKKLTDAGFENVTKAGEEYDDFVEAGLIKSQTPEYTGEQISKDTAITYVISLGPKEFSMPSLIGKTVEEAESILKNTGLAFSYTYVAGDEKDIGKIKAQSIQAGELTKKGESVVLSIVTQKQTINVENVVGLDKAEAESKLKAQGFKVNASAEEYSDEPKGRVIRQNPDAGTPQTEGTTITIVVSKGQQEVSVIRPSEDSKPTPQPETTIFVANVVGKTRNVAEATVKNQGFAVSVKTVYSDSYASGYVMEQSPAANSSQKKGTTITITVSKGTQKISVPNVVGKNRSDAKSAIEAQGLIADVKESYNSSVEKGKVFSQSPNADSMVEKGASVIVMVSLGQQPPTAVTVPDVTGKSQSAATSALTDAGLKVSTKQSYSDKVASGNVISQSPLSGSSVDKGSTVTITVSKGKQKVSVPNVVGKSQSAATSELTNAGLKVSTKQSYSDTVASGNVISQSPSSGNSVDKGSTVTITVSKGKNSISVTLDANGGSVSQSSKTVYKGSSYGDLPTPTRSGFTFDGWHTSDGKAVNSMTLVSNSSNHTLRAYWISGWVSENDVPYGVNSVEQKWKYTYTTYSDRWERTGGGTHYFGSFPSGYNTSDQYYWMNRGALDSYDNGNTKREVGGASFNSYIYWHWCYPTGAGSEYNRFIGDYYNEAIYGNNGAFRGYATIWEAFESQDGGSSNGDGTYKLTGHSSESWHWKRIDIYRQDYTEYKKVTDSDSSERESSTQVTAGGNISNVRKYVKYQIK